MQKENIFTHKILPILSILILVSYIFVCNNVFAYSSTDVAKAVDDATLNACLARKEYNPDTMNYVVCTHTDGVYFFFWDKSSGVVPYVEFSNNNFVLYFGISNEQVAFNYYQVLNDYSSLYRENTILRVPLSSNNFSSNLNVFNVTTGSYFFHLPPLTLVEELEKIQVTEVWKTLMKNVVVSLLAFLVGFLALRKAWAWLKNQLRKA